MTATTLMETPRPVLDWAVSLLASRKTRLARQETMVMPSVVIPHRPSVRQEMATPAPVLVAVAAPPEDDHHRTRPLPRLIVAPVTETERIIASAVELFYLAHGYPPKEVLLSPLRWLAVSSEADAYAVRSDIIETAVRLSYSAGLSDAQARCLRSIGTKKLLS